MKKWHVMLLAMFLVGLATASFAAPPNPGPQGPQRGPESWSHEGFHHRFGAWLNLSKEQMDKIRELRNRYYMETHDLRYDIRMKHLELEKFFTDPKVDDATLLAKEKELGALKLKLMDRKAQMKIEWRKILTPEQIQKLGEFPRRHRHHGR